MDYKSNDFQCRNQNIIIQRERKEIAQKLYDDAMRSAISLRYMYPGTNASGTSISQGNISIGFGAA